jgi:hypothetical protein
MLGSILSQGSFRPTSSVTPAEFWAKSFNRDVTPLTLVAKGNSPH